VSDGEEAAPGLSVVIPCKDGAARLPQTLRAIGDQEVPAAIEVVVADDGSKDGTREIAAAARTPWGPVRVVRHEAPRGRGAACNTAIAVSRAPVIVILDDDMTLQPGALEAHRAFHAAHPGAAALGRIPLAPAARLDCYGRFLEREEAHRERTLAAHAAGVPFRYCLTGHFSAPRATLEAAGGFDASITRYGFEDIDLAWRMTRRGTKIHWLPAAVAQHRNDAGGLDRMLERHREAGLVARQLAARHPEEEFRQFLRAGEGAPLELGRIPAALSALRLLHRALQVAPLRRLAASGPGFGLVRGAIGLAEAAGAERLAHFGYHVARDIRYFEALFDAPGA